VPVANTRNMVNAILSGDGRAPFTFPPATSIEGTRTFASETLQYYRVRRRRPRDLEFRSTTSRKCTIGSSPSRCPEPGGCDGDVRGVNHCAAETVHHARRAFAAFSAGGRKACPARGAQAT
jgi:hypothetical protein